ncbi:MAG: methyltransferase domain-containing protein [Anaerolineaceae bacterium]
MPTAAEAYAACVLAAHQQAARVSAPRSDRWASRAAMFRLDPRRKLESNTAAVAALVGPDDVVVDVGGGAGRVSLPIALQCARVVNVEPSGAMRKEFDASAAEAGITNAACIDADWPGGAKGLEGDVVLVANVTYFVSDIVPFLAALTAAARKRVIISVWSVPPPNDAARVFLLVHGETQALAPTHRELLPVLWDMGVLPEIRVLPDEFRTARMRPPTVDDAVKLAVEVAAGNEVSGAAEKVRQHFDELYAQSAEGFVPRWRLPSREMLITWETR